MLKQKEIFKFKVEKKNLRKFKRFFKYSNSLINPIYQSFITEKNNIEYQISIKITANNTFCSLKKGKTLLFVSSAGKNKIKITKRKLIKHQVTSKQMP